MEGLKGISTHALERFKERWEILNGKKIKEGNALFALQDLILRSQPESKESLILLKRKEKHGGNVRYMISGPWRLIWQDGSLVTVELRDENTEVSPAERHRVNAIKKEEKTRIKRLRAGAPRTRV